MTPYYDHNGKCECGCGGVPNREKRFISGHNLKNLKRTQQHCLKISNAQKMAWKTKRKRLPIGTKYVNHYGYIDVKVVDGKGAWALEHRLIAEKVVGRKLDKTEVVHHINGIKSDNRNCNLIICSKKYHSELEQKMSDLYKKEHFCDG